MGKFKEALKDYENVQKHKPTDPDLKKRLTECRKVRREHFYKKSIEKFQTNQI